MTDEIPLYTLKQCIWGTKKRNVSSFVYEVMGFKQPISVQKQNLGNNIQTVNGREIRMTADHLGT